VAGEPFGHGGLRIETKRVARIGHGSLSLGSKASSSTSG
jgi:hypothetical protein